VRHEVITQRAKTELGRFLGGLDECEEVCENAVEGGGHRHLLGTQLGRVWFTLKNHMCLLGGTPLGTGLVLNIFLAQDIHLIQDMTSAAE
jgi:hypothetical protein